jgi:transcriptional regulator with XRE-family HTH domain
MKISSAAVDERNRLADRIRRARRGARLSQTALAARVGVTSSAVAQWEHPNGTCPALARLQSIATATAVNFEWRATGRDQQHRATRHHGHETPAIKLDLFALDDNEETLLRRFRALSPRGRQMLVGFLQELKAGK